MFDLHPAFTINPVPSRAGDKVKIKYHGLLANSGADQIWLHTGFGADNWQDQYDYRMNRNSDGWEETVEIIREGSSTSASKTAPATGTTTTCSIGATRSGDNFVKCEDGCGIWHWHVLRILSGRALARMRRSQCLFI